MDISVGDRVRVPGGAEGEVRSIRPRACGWTVTVAIDRYVGQERLAPGAVWMIEAYRDTDLTRMGGRR